MDARQELLSEIDGFLAQHRMAPTTFGLKALKDGKFVGRLREGGNLTIRTIERARQFMREYEPTPTAEPERKAS